MAASPGHAAQGPAYAELACTCRSPSEPSLQQPYLCPSSPLWLPAPAPSALPQPGSPPTRASRPTATTAAPFLHARTSRHAAAHALASVHGKGQAPLIVWPAALAVVLWCFQWHPWPNAACLCPAALLLVGLTKLCAQQYQPYAAPRSRQTSKDAELPRQVKIREASTGDYDGPVPSLNVFAGRPVGWEGGALPITKVRVACVC